MVIVVRPEHHGSRRLRPTLVLSRSADYRSRWRKGPTDIPRVDRFEKENEINTFRRRSRNKLQRHRDTRSNFTRSVLIFVHICCPISSSSAHTYAGSYSIRYARLGTPWDPWLQYTSYSYCHLRRIIVWYITQYQFTYPSTTIIII